MVTRVCKKNLMIIRSIESDYIEEAYLLLKEVPANAESESEITREATQIIVSCMKKLPSGKGIPSPVFWTVLGGGITALLFSVFLLIL